MLRRYTFVKIIQAILESLQYIMADNDHPIIAVIIHVSSSSFASQLEICPSDENRHRVHVTTCLYYIYLYTPTVAEYRGTASSHTCRSSNDKGATVFCTKKRVHQYSYTYKENEKISVGTRERPIRGEMRGDPVSLSRPWLYFICTAYLLREYPA